MPELHSPTTHADDPRFPKLPPAAALPLSLVLLARDAEAHVPALVPAWAAALRARETDYEIIFVDEEDSGRAAAVAEGLAAGTPGLRVLRAGGRGFGAALREGLAAATLPLVAYAPCDPEYDPAGLALLLAGIDRSHLVAGFRGGRRVPWPWRLLGLGRWVAARLLFGQAPPRLPGWLGWRGHLAAWLARPLFGVRVRDVGCPFRLFRREILNRAPVQSDGDFAHVEFLAKVNFASCVLDEVVLPARAPLGPAGGGRLRQLVREAGRVFSHPDFGPPQLPERSPPAGPPAPAPPEGGASPSAPGV
jgi:hypothetical protein